MKKECPIRGISHSIVVTSLYTRSVLLALPSGPTPVRGGSAGVNAGLYMRLCVRIALASEGIRKLAPHHVVVGQWLVPHEMHVTSLYTRSVLLALPSGPSQPPPLCAVRIGGCECGSLHALVRPDRAGLGI